MLSADQYTALLMTIANQQIQIFNLNHELEELKKVLPQPPTEPVGSNGSYADVFGEQ